MLSAGTVAAITVVIWLTNRIVIFSREMVAGVTRCCYARTFRMIGTIAKSSAVYERTFVLVACFTVIFALTNSIFQYETLVTRVDRASSITLAVFVTSHVTCARVDVATCRRTWRTLVLSTNAVH